MAELDDARRLQAIHDLHLTDATTDEVFDGATRLASRIMGVPVALVSVVTEDRQVFASQVGLDEPWASRAQTPLSHSFCQHVVATERPLKVRDAREDDLLRDNLAIEDLNVVAYYGVPLHAPDGEVVGSFCAIDGSPRDWDDGDLLALSDLARLIERVLVARRSTDRLVAVLEDRRNLVATIVHDVRQPLTGARMAAETLKRGLPPETREMVLDALTRQVTRVDDLLGELVGATPAHRAVDVAAVAEEVRAQAERAPTGAVEVDVQDGAAWTGDRTDLDRIVTNLVRNAHVHGGDDVTVRMVVRRREDGIEIVVTDDGRGIEEADLERIFELRQQGASSGGGSGLGLHIVRSLAREYGGDVVVDSAPGQGATFTVTLPNAADEDRSIPVAP